MLIKFFFLQKFLISATSVKAFDIDGKLTTNSLVMFDMILHDDNNYRLILVIILFGCFFLTDQFFNNYIYFCLQHT